MTVEYIETENASFLSPNAGQGVSSEADYLQEILKEVRTEVFQNVALGEPRQEALSALWNAYLECSTDNWDGYGAKAATLRAYREAKRFIESLPTSVPIPEISVDPDGEFTFEWYAGPRNIFSVSVSHNSELTYAGLFSHGKTHGVEYFGEYFSDELSESILTNLRRLLREIP